MRLWSDFVSVFEDIFNALELKMDGILENGLKFSKNKIDQQL